MLKPLAYNWLENWSRFRKFKAMQFSIKTNPTCIFRTNYVLDFHIIMKAWDHCGFNWKYERCDLLYTHLYTYTHVHTHKYTHASTHTNTFSRTHIHTRVGKITPPHTRTHVRTHTHALARTHTHTHTYTYTYTYIW